MSRSKWKGPYIDSIDIKNLPSLNRTENSYMNIKISRNTTVVPEFVEHILKVHNGKTWVEITVTEEMIGYKFGEFSATRKRFSFKKTKK
mmetsp:Transcript_22885/g.43525  ORF Transcript_22885/g.43525 Transcript_22885/m.43525 type:complete len:89 (+) Transcript_22885:47-313(+)